MFYVLRLPSSSYIIRRFLSSFVIIETDIWLFNRTSFTYFLPNSYYFAYIVYKVRKLLCHTHINKKKLLRHNRSRKRSIASIVYYFLNKRRFVFRNLKKKRVIKVCRFDANTIKKRDVSKYDPET